MTRGTSTSPTAGLTATTIAPLRNVAALVELIERCGGRNANLPGMALFYGPSGFGKTMAAAYAAGRYNAVHIEIRSLWSAKKLAQKLATEVGLTPRGSAADIIDQVCEHLAVTQRPVIIDEADYLLEKANMVNIPRDLFEGSNAPVILIGEERMPEKLKRWERLDGRLLDRVAAQPGTREDVDLLAPIYAPGLQLADGLKQIIHTQSMHSVRRIATNLSRVAEFARTRGLEAVSEDHFDEKDLTSGVAPKPRATLERETAIGARRMRA